MLIYYICICKSMDILMTVSHDFIHWNDNLTMHEHTMSMCTCTVSIHKCTYLYTYCTLHVTLI